jgi:hypothetical protein
MESAQTHNKTQKFHNITHPGRGNITYCHSCSGVAVELRKATERRMRIAHLVAIVSVASAFTSPLTLPSAKNGYQKILMVSSSNEEETSRRIFLGSAAAIAALFPQVARAAPTKKVGGGLASKIRNVGNVMVCS